MSVKFIVKKFLKYFILMVFLTGCANLKEVDVSLTGIELEYYPAHPYQEEPSIFEGFDTHLPKLMPMNKDKK